MKLLIFDDLSLFTYLLFEEIDGLMMLHKFERVQLKELEQISNRHSADFILIAVKCLDKKRIISIRRIQRLNPMIPVIVFSYHSITDTRFKYLPDFSGHFFNTFHQAPEVIEFIKQLLAGHVPENIQNVTADPFLFRKRRKILI